MFEKLDQIDWEHLQHAYGPASDVPKLLHDVVSDDPDVSEHALDDLVNNINHQTSIYEATSYVVPFFREILLEGPAHTRVAMLYLLRDLGGYGAPQIESAIPERKTTPEPEFEPADSGRTKLDRRGDQRYLDSEDDEYFREAIEERRRWRKEWEVYEGRIYEQVHNGLSSYPPFLEDANAKIRAPAAELLSLFGEDANYLVPKLTAAIAAETDPLTKGDIVASLGELLARGMAINRAQGQMANITPHAELLNRLMSEKETPWVRFCAAEALAIVLRSDAPAEAIQVLKVAVTEPDQYSVDSQHRDTTQIVYTARHALQYTGQGKGLPALIAGLRALPSEEHPYELTESVEAILDLAFGGQQVSGWYPSYNTFKDGIRVLEYTASTDAYKGKDGALRSFRKKEAPIVPIESLSMAQRLAVGALVDYEPFWKYRTNLLTLYGLPVERGELREMSQNGDGHSHV